MEQIALSDQDRAIILDLTAELRRFNDNVEKNKPETWMTYKEAADYLGRCYQTISSWVRCGRLRSHLIGRSQRIAKSDLDSLIRKPIV